MNCTICSNMATSYNSKKQPVCSRHLKAVAVPPMCPECGIAMVMRQGKFGSFWGCAVFPSCDGVKKI